MKKRMTALMLMMIFLMVPILSSCGIFSREKETDEALEVNAGVAGEKEPDTEENTTEEETTEEPTTEDKHEFDFTVCFAGDINLDENWDTTHHLDEKGGDITGCISPELIKIMNDADLMCLNNEFTYSTGGAPTENKMYTFRANPDRVKVLGALGVDVVGLANNHVHDYGKQSILDTFETLEKAGIPYVGAGRNLQEAMKPYYTRIDGKTIAIVAASRAEKWKMTPQATETEPGILRCYDTELFMQEIREARQNADFVIAFVHWGTEDSYVLEEVQLTTGKEYLDAGCDVVIGAHPHWIQGMEYYNGKPIIYSLGNYWFNSESLETMLVQLHFKGDDDGSMLEVEVIPAMQTGCETHYAEGDERDRIFRLLEEISINVKIDENGIVRETN